MGKALDRKEEWIVDEMSKKLSRGAETHTTFAYLVNAFVW